MNTCAPWTKRDERLEGIRQQLSQATSVRGAGAASAQGRWRAHQEVVILLPRKLCSATRAVLKCTSRCCGTEATCGRRTQTPELQSSGVALRSAACERVGRPGRLSHPTSTSASRAPHAPRSTDAQSLRLSPWFAGYCSRKITRPNRNHGFQMAPPLLYILTLNSVVYGIVHK